MVDDWTLGSLYSGIGGLEAGLEQAGMRTVWQVEIDGFCRQVLAKRFPGVEQHNDVREVGAHNLKPVKVMAGGFPCQDVSNSGLKAGIDGARSGLWSEFRRIIGELRPEYVVVENVAALLGRGMGRVLGDLSALGYDAEWSVVSACSFGAPHTRERVFIVAYPQTYGQDRWRDGGPAKEPAESPGCYPRGGWPWSTEPRPFGVVDGVPRRMDRLGALGNAVVPHVGEWVGRRIIEWERMNCPTAKATSRG